MSGMLLLYMLCILLSIDITTADEGEHRVKSVDRFISNSETDIVNFEGNCAGRLCENIGGFMLQGKCQCRCSSGKVFIISRKVCETEKNINENYIISKNTDADEYQKISKASSYQLQNGLYIKHCTDNKCQLVSSCEIDLEKSVFDGKTWQRLWLQQKDVTLKVYTVNSHIKIKFVKNIKNTNMYNGLLLKIGLTCTVMDGEKVESFVVFEVTGSFLGVFPTTSHGNVTTDQQADSKKKSMEVLIVAVVLAIFLIISCVLLVCMFRRWREAKQQTNRHNSEPQFSFEPTTPVFLVPNDGSKKLPAGEEDKLREPAINVRSPPEEKKKDSSIRQLYASIDKFFKLSKKRKSNGSLDEGYTTDDNYDYRRFAAFPKELYDEPGSVISSSDEPDYKIPEDFVANDTVIVNVNNEYLVPKIPDNANQVVYLTPEPHYDQVGQRIPKNESPYYNVTKNENNYSQVVVRDESVKKLECPFAAPGGQLLTRNTKLPDYRKDEENTVHPYDKVGRVMSTRSKAENGAENDPKVNPYDEIGRVMSTKAKLNDNLEVRSDDVKTVNPYDQVGRVMSTKPKLSKKENLKTVSEEETVHPYDEVGTLLCDKIKLHRKNEVDDKYLTMTGDVNPYDEVGDVISDKDCAENDPEYDEPAETENPIEYDQPENIIDRKSIKEEKSIKKPTRKPPKPPRPASFEVVVNRHVGDDEVDV
ncbi:uncharacterized protein LOC130625761 isoform X2 [Hydractinia symbiolongicarpus]|uniref:uncharacterized protein LOC130625761 isoform X2 n=1 Tax=Hydractinia symbiolongicarpus TaxID=13093 RepID=UPI00254C8F28|nr:uncharacterized protein LOC130625761 isoform X2 [Hydractinia symbiolongicarpus]